MFNASWWKDKHLIILILLIHISYPNYSIGIEQNEYIYHTKNFVVYGESLDDISKIGNEAEMSFARLTNKWIKPPEKLRYNVEIHYEKALKSSTGSTTISSQKHLIVVDMKGPMRQIIGILLPHEMTHIIMHNRFGRALPLWLSEGLACSSEIDHDLANFPFEPLTIDEIIKTSTYPIVKADCINFYKNSYWLVRFLNQKCDNYEFIRYTYHYLKSRSLTSDLIGYDNITDLEKDWMTYQLNVIRSSRYNDHAESLVLPSKSATMTINVCD